MIKSGSLLKYCKAISFDKMDYYIHSTAVVEEDAIIGTNTKIWHFAHVRKGSKIGKHCNIGKSVYIDSNVSIGNGVKIQNFVSVYHGVTIEDDVFVGPSVAFTNDLRPRAWIWSEQKIAKTLVKKGSSIGGNATIIAGITIGEYAMVGAGAVVTKDVEPYQVVYGNPAKPHGWVCKCGVGVSGQKQTEKCEHEVDT